MIVYDAGILDWFNGMTKLTDYIKLCYDKECIEKEAFYHTQDHLKGYLSLCFMELKSRIYYWEGDIRDHDCIAISAIPTNYCSTSKILALKQNNNGSSFIISEAPLYFDNEFTELEYNPSLKPGDMMLFYKESLELISWIYSPVIKVIDDKFSMNEFQPLAR